MELVKKSSASKFVGSSTTTIFEYLMNESTINGAIAVINGRYPEKGYAKNTISKELVYILEGKGVIGFPDKEIVIKKGDCLILQPNEIYYWNGTMKLFMACTPAWKPEQHEITD